MKFIGIQCNSLKIAEIHLDSMKMIEIYSNITGAKIVVLYGLGASGRQNQCICKVRAPPGVQTILFVMSGRLWAPKPLYLYIVPNLV